MDDEPRLFRSVDPPRPASGPPFPSEKWWVVQDWVLTGPHPGSASSAVADWRLGELLDLGVTCFIDLTPEASETDLRPRPYPALLNELAHARGLRASHLRFPIRGLPEVWLMRTILRVIRELIADGRMIYMHDGGDLALTGIVVGCLAFETGVPLDQITRQVRRIRRHEGGPESGSPPVESSTEFIRNWPGEFNPLFTPDGLDGSGSARTTPG